MKIGRPRKPGKASYDAIHNRLDAARGTAQAYICTECEGPAQEWAYDGKDPTPSKSIDPKGHQVTYSQDLKRYQPMCRRCHRRLDLERRCNEAEKQRLGIM